jgi:hypothetical protein
MVALLNPKDKFNSVIEPFFSFGGGGGGGVWRSNNQQYQKNPTKILWSLELLIQKKKRKKRYHTQCFYKIGYGLHILDNKNT